MKILFVDHHGRIGGVLVDTRELALGLVVARQLVNAPHFGHYRVDARLAMRGVGVPELGVVL
jgi:hypothetical protein